eukprot:gene26992-58989_t
MGEPVRIHGLTGATTPAVTVLNGRRGTVMGVRADGTVLATAAARAALAARSNAAQWQPECTNCHRSFVSRNALAARRAPAPPRSAQQLQGCRSAQQGLRSAAPDATDRSVGVEGVGVVGIECG